MPRAESPGDRTPESDRCLIRMHISDGFLTTIKGRLPWSALTYYWNAAECHGLKIRSDDGGHDLAIKSIALGRLGCRGDYCRAEECRSADCGCSLGCAAHEARLLVMHSD